MCRGSLGLNKRQAGSSTGSKYELPLLRRHSQRDAPALYWSGVPQWNSSSTMQGGCFVAAMHAALRLALFKGHKPFRTRCSCTLL